jgi:hypothetical protein
MGITSRKEEITMKSTQKRVARLANGKKVRNIGTLDGKKAKKHV